MAFSEVFIQPILVNFENLLNAKCRVCSALEATMSTLRRHGLQEDRKS